MVYFEDIYTSTRPTRVDEVMNMIPTKVIREMNAELTKDITSEQVWSALYQMHLIGRKVTLVLKEKS